MSQQLLLRRSWERALSTSGAAAGSSESAESAEAEAKAEDPKAAEAASAEGAEAAASADGADGAAAAEGGEADPLAELQAKVADLETQLEAKHDQALRALAEAENARRRAGIDVQNAKKFAVDKFAKSLLDVADNLSRAAESVPEEMRASEEVPQLKALYDGVVMTETVLLKAFSEHGLVRLWPLEEKFDPNLHNALFEIPDPDKEAGIVAHVASAGYTLNDRVIRPAGVGVTKAP